MNVNSNDIKNKGFIYHFLILGWLVLLLSYPVQAAQDFIVQHIDVEGLQRINLETVLNYLPIQEGDRLDPEDTANVIRALYDTGFFQNVELIRQDSTLIIKVIERPTIGNIDISGNREISKDQLASVMSQLGLEEGEIFQLSDLELFEQDLKREYNNRGKYNAIISTSVTPQSQNRVGVNIDVSEGSAAKIKSINIIGNEAFSTGELLQQFSLSTPNILKLTFITGGDQYGQEKLDASLEALSSFYLDRGYLEFRVESSQVLLSPDKKDVYIDIRIHEGQQYTFSGYQLTGDLVVSEELLASFIDIKVGDVYSYQTVTQSITLISEVLGNAGYGFPDINVEPTVNEENLQVFITFIIDPGRHIYVRRINFFGNTRTSDDVLRRALYQEEGGLLSLQNIRESERQLRILPYMEDISVETVPVSGTNNQVDLDFHVMEAPSAEAFASVGYGTNGFEVNAGLEEFNFMGTGRNVGFNFITSLWVTSYSINYFNPYYKVNGLGRGFNLYFSKFTPGRLNIATFTSDRFGGNVNYSYLLNNTSSVQFGYGYEHLDISSGGMIRQIDNFLDENGHIFEQARLTAGWANNTFDRFPFPTRGWNQQITALTALPAAKNALSFFKASYLARYYRPIPKDFIFTALASFAYGNQYNSRGLPFFENYYAGGIADPGQVRGFESYSLGPRDDMDNPLGGNVLINGSVGLILPYPISRDNLRIAAFVDGGNVYAFGLPQQQRGTGSGPIRYSGGVSAEWRSPFGPLLFSVALPINKQEEDRTQVFQFTLSSGF